MMQTGRLIDANQERRRLHRQWHTAVAVMPKRRLSRAVETMLTALVIVRMALRKSPSRASPMAISLCCRRYRFTLPAAA
jgi:hypothetical protein